MELLFFIVGNMLAQTHTQILATLFHTYVSCVTFLFQRCYRVMWNQHAGVYGIFLSKRFTLNMYERLKHSKIYLTPIFYKLLSILDQV